MVLYYSTATLPGKTSPVIAAAEVDVDVDEPQLVIKTVAVTANKNTLNLCILCPKKLSKIPTQTSLSWCALRNVN